MSDNQWFYEKLGSSFWPLEEKYRYFWSIIINVGNIIRTYQWFFKLLKLFEKTWVRSFRRWYTVCGLVAFSNCNFPSFLLTVYYEVKSVIYCVLKMLFYSLLCLTSATNDILVVNIMLIFLFWVLCWMGVAAYFEVHKTSAFNSVMNTWGVAVV